MSIADVQRFSLHDGPGIRTTVFLKGCNLRCRWCHNPESLRPEPQVQFTAARCIGCGACLRACPAGAHRLVDGRHELDRSACRACGACAAGCYTRALLLIGGQWTPESAMEQVLADLPFYAASGGGMTLSGGEPLAQPELTRRLLERAKAAGVHTAIETNLAYPWPRLAELLCLLDLVMADVKMMDEAAHRRWTGDGNAEVLANVRRLAEQAVPVIIRTPVIVGVNAEPAAIGAVADLLRDMPNLLYYELLAHHPLGQGKYESLGMSGDGAALLGRPDEPTMRTLAEEARKHGIAVRA